MARFPFLKPSGNPVLDISESEADMVVKAEPPGPAPKGVELTLPGDALTIRGEIKFEEEEQKNNSHRMERSYGSFSRNVLLPAAVQGDAVKARFDKGVLVITLPKASKQKAQSIAIEP